MEGNESKSIDERKVRVGTKRSKEGLHASTWFNALPIKGRAYLSRKPDPRPNARIVIGPVERGDAPSDRVLAPIQSALGVIGLELELKEIVRLLCQASLA